MIEAVIETLSPNLPHPYRVDVEGGSGRAGVSEECTTPQEAIDFAIEAGATVLYGQIYGQNTNPQS